MFCAYIRPIYQVSAYRTIGPLVDLHLVIKRVFVAKYLKEAIGA